MEITPEIVGQYFPRIVSWVARMENAILERGQPLFPINSKDAEKIGVRQIDHIRIAAQENIPLPTDDEELCRLILKTGLITPQTVGVTFGHGVVLKNGTYDRRVIAHELVHVLQYERFGGIEPFLEAYIPEIVYPPGYPYGLLEQEAIRVALSLF
jgi:hypothetical protein